MAKLRWDKGGVIRDWEVQPRATALLLLNLQTGNVDPERGAGPELRAGFPKQAAYYYDALSGHALAAAARLLEFFREQRLPVVHAHSALALGGAEIAPWSWRHRLLAGEARHHAAPGARSPEAAGLPYLADASAPDSHAWPPFAARQGELVLIEQTLSPFNGTAIDQYLRNMGVENLVLAGVLTNTVVETTARDAGDRGFNAIVVSDACAALSPEDHEAGTAFASWHIVRTAAELLGELDGLLAR